MEVLCIGIGNAFRQDDSVGLHVAEALRARNLPGLHVSTHSREGVSLLNTWEAADAVILIDAVAPRAKAGTIYRFQAHSLPLPEAFFPRSTHTLGVGEAVELARKLDQLPSCCIVFGIQGENF
jgi:hydrogenase maturation protease